MAQPTRTLTGDQAQPVPDRWWSTADGDWSFSFVVAFASLLPRLYVALAWSREPVWDGHYYHFGATRIAQGLGYSEDIVIDGQAVWKPWCHYPVGYSGALGGLYKVFGAELWVAPVFNAIVGALTVLVLHRLARFVLSGTRARIAATLCALHPGIILYTAVVMTEGLSAFTLVLGGLCAVALAKRGWLAAASSGLVLGLGALVRPTALLAVPWLVLMFSGSRLRSLRNTILAGFCALLIISPWTLRNCRVMDACTLISTNGGWNLAIGALTETGRFSTLRAGMGCPGPGQVAQDRCWGAIGREKILEDPLRWLSLVPAKLRHTYNHESFVVGYLAEANPQLWTEGTKNQVRELITLFHHLLMFAAALSVVGRAALRWPFQKPAWVQLAVLGSIAAFCQWALGQDEPPLFWLLVATPLLALSPLPGRPWWGPAGVYCWGLLISTSLTHAVFFGEDRYHMTISPILCLLAAAVLRPSWERWRSDASVDLPHTKGAGATP